MGNCLSCHRCCPGSVEVLAEVLTSGDRGGERIRKARTLCGEAQGRSGMDARRSSGLDVAGRAEGSAWQDVFMLLRQRNSLVTPQGAAAAAAGVSPQANTMAAATQ
ncbi:uncharacterized protein LOC144938510 [Lampetra fluviatilis]